MKKLLTLLLACFMMVGLVACSNNSETPSTDTPETDTPTESEYKIAMVTDYGDITDQSFNQSTYEACRDFAEDNGLEFNYFKPAGNTTPERVAMMESAIDEGYNVIVTPGYAFAEALIEVAPLYPDVKFVALDVAESDFLGTKLVDNLDFKSFRGELRKGGKQACDRCKKTVKHEVAVAGAHDDVVENVGHVCEKHNHKDGEYSDHLEQHFPQIVKMAPEGFVCQLVIVRFRHQCLFLFVVFLFVVDWFVDFVLYVVDTFFEAADSFTDTAHEFGDFFSAKKKEYDKGNEENLRCSKIVEEKQSIHRCFDF